MHDDAGITDVEEEEKDLTTDKEVDAGNSVSQMVELFGSAKQKRAFTAAQKNKIESNVLETALESAVAHAETKLDEIPTAG